MACGNTEVSRSGLLSEPTAQGHPTAPARTSAQKSQAQQQVKSAARELKAAATQVARAATWTSVERTMGKAKAAINSARRGNAPKAEIQRLEKSFDKLQRNAKEKSERIAHDEARSAAQATAAGNEVQAALHKHLAQSSAPPAPEALATPSAGTVASMELAEKWSANYEKQTGNQLFDIKLGACTYTFDTAAGRLVCVRGHSTTPAGPRDAGRQKGHPRAPKGDHKGHPIAHSMGGGLDINLVNQSAKINLGKQWRDIEKLAAKNPGTAVAVHMLYDDDSDRPAAFEYGYDHPESGFQVEHFENS